MLYHLSYATEYTIPGSNRGPLACEASVITN
jgi:hypothetical protein